MWRTCAVVVGDAFIAIGIAFENTAGPNANQAVAIRVDSDFSLFQGCSFNGYQDTLYTHTGRQFYGNCTITGTVDFIFGNSAAVFWNCQLVVRGNRPGTTTSFVSAQGRTDPGQTTGLVFRNCTVTSSTDYTEIGHSAYLGRPWKMFSRTIYINTYIDSLVAATGWFPWNGDFALASLLYGEYNSYGPGTVNISSRVSWSNQLALDEAQYFTVDNFIQGSWWLPATLANITYGEV
jgi:pectin methylesterase-like acyl-CoA thioesterase